MSEKTIKYSDLFWISLLAGYVGADRFFVGKMGTGTLKLLTGGGLGIWWIIDLFTIASGKFTDASGRKVENTSKQKGYSFFFSIVFIIGMLTQATDLIGITNIYGHGSLKDSEDRWQKEAELRKIEEEKPKRYEEMYGEIIDAFEVNSLFEKNRLQANKACNKSPIQIEGKVTDISSNTYGNYIDLETKIGGSSLLLNEYKKGARSDIRIFLEESNWNNEAIARIKQKDKIVAGGLCYGQTELFGGIKSSIIIGNARILKIGKEYL